MSYGFLDIAATPSVRAAQAAMGSDRVYQDFNGDRAFDKFTPNEASFIAQRDSLALSIADKRHATFVFKHSARNEIDWLQITFRPSRFQSRALECGGHVIRGFAMFGAARVASSHLVVGEKLDVRPPRLRRIRRAHLRSREWRVQRGERE